jgi:hypothetical protein
VGASSPQVKAAVEKVFAAGGVDYVVQNDLRFLSEGRHPYSVFSSETVLLGEGAIGVGSCAFFVKPY